MNVISDLVTDYSFVELIFSNDNNYIVAASRNYGLACINIKDPNNLFIEQIVRTTGGFSLTSSKDGLFAFAAEGPKGLSIIDLSKLPKISFVGRVAIDGTVFHVNPIMNDKFVLVSSNVVGYISLVDARDLQNLQVIAKFGV